MPQKTKRNSEGGWMPQTTEIEYPTVAEGGRMDATKDRKQYPTVAEEGRMDATRDRKKISNRGKMDATKDRNKISNSGRGREDGCHKRQK